MHIKRLSKPAYAANAGGFDLAPVLSAKGGLFTGVANLTNSLINLLQIQRVFGQNIAKS